MNFKKGQEIVCVKTHSRGLVKEGELHVVKNLNNCPNCGDLIIDVGMTTEKFITECYCHTLIRSYGIHWFSHKLFKPLDDLFNEEINELLKEITLEETI